jgi:hypothetical protein
MGLMKTSGVFRRAYSVAAALMGVLFFFTVVGVFRLPLAIGGLACGFNVSTMCLLLHLRCRTLGVWSLDMNLTPKTFSGCSNSPRL